MWLWFTKYSQSQRLTWNLFTSFLFTYQDTNYPLSILATDKNRPADIFSIRRWTDSRYFLYCCFSTLGFSYLVDFEDSDVFRKETGFPIIYGDLIENLYQLLNTRTKKEILLSTNLLVMVLFRRIMTTTTLTARVWLLFLARMSFVKSFTLSLVSILTKKGYQT